MITFLTVFIPTHPANLPCGRKLERPEKTHDCWQSVERLFSHESVASLEPTISELKGACSDDCATEHLNIEFTIDDRSHLCPFSVHRKGWRALEDRDTTLTAFTNFMSEGARSLQTRVPTLSQGFSNYIGMHILYVNN